MGPLSPIARFGLRTVSDDAKAWEADALAGDLLLVQPYLESTVFSLKERKLIRRFPPQSPSTL